MDGLNLDVGLAPLGSGINKGPSADLLILVWGEGDPPGNPERLLASVLLGAQLPLPREIPPVSFQEVSPFLLQSAMVTSFCVTQKTEPVHQLSSVLRTDTGVALACLKTCFKQELFLFPEG